MNNYDAPIVNKDIYLPFKSITEHINECLAVLDLFLETAQKGTAPNPLLESAITHLRLREDRTRSHGIFLPLADLAVHFNLSEFEYFLILIALAPEINSRYGFAYSQVQGDGSFFYPTLDFARTLYSFHKAVRLTDLMKMTCRHHRLNQTLFYTSVNPKDYCSIKSWILVLKKPVLLYLLGDFVLDDTLEGICTILPQRTAYDFLCLPVFYQKLKNTCQSILSRASRLTLFCLIGQKGSGRKFQLSLLMGCLSLELISVDMEKFYGLDDESVNPFLENLLSSVSLLSGTLLLDRVDPKNPQDQKRLVQLLSYFSKYLKLLFLSSANALEAWGLSGFPAIHISYPAPAFPQRLTAWQHFSASYSLDAGIDLSSLATSHSLTPGAIKNILGNGELLRIYEDTKEITKSQLLEAISQNRTLALGTAATPIPAHFSWDDLIIPPRQKQIMELACRRIRNQHKVGEQWGINRILPYGKGLSLLFFGPPGTGKTMAAQVISHDLGLDLYRIDLSQLFSKYIGETEKTIHLIFEEAKKSDIILFFDEADAVFAKRTEVSNSNDKYSNNAISYILQKIEEYDGMVILSTNFYQNIDTAFLRRITYTVRFEMPRKEERLRLWTQLLPKEAPLSPEVNLAQLAEHFELSGSEIKSILISAAYMAADEADEISPAHIITALKYEFSKSGRTLSDQQLAQYGIYSPSI